MKTRTLCVVAAALSLLALRSGHAAVHSVVTEWLLIAQETVATLGIEHQQAALLYALVSTVQYEAIKSAQARKLSVEAAAAFGSHAILSANFNWLQSYKFDPVLATQLAQLGLTDEDLPKLKDAVQCKIKKVLSAKPIISSAAFVDFKPAIPSPETLGQYQFAPGQTTVHYPQLALAPGLFLSNADLTDVTSRLKKFALDDPEYAKQLNEVFWLGSVNSRNRSTYDTDSVRFWALGSGTSTLAGQWINISISVLPETTSLAHQARFFQLLTSSFWDAAVACWRVKFGELFWRPVTALRTFHGVRPADPTWTPLLPTPIDPEYPSAHQASSGVALYLLETFLGADVAFETPSAGAPDLGSRPYLSFREAAAEVGKSRLFAGVHFPKSNEDGLALGQQVAQQIHTRFFKGYTFADRV